MASCGRVTALLNRIAGSAMCRANKAGKDSSDIFHNFNFAGEYAELAKRSN